MPTGEGDDVPPGEESGGLADDVDLVGVVLGLGLMLAIGLALGGVTVAALWALYPPTRGSSGMTAVALGSVAAAAGGWGVLTRRLGRRAADWFILGYGLAWLLLVLVIMGGATVEFVRSHAVQTFGLPTS